MSKKKMVKIIKRRTTKINFCLGFKNKILDQKRKKIVPFWK